MTPTGPGPWGFQSYPTQPWKFDTPASKKIEFMDKFYRDSIRSISNTRNHTTDYRLREGI